MCGTEIEPTPPFHPCCISLCRQSGLRIFGDRLILYSDPQGSFVLLPLPSPSYNYYYHQLKFSCFPFLHLHISPPHTKCGSISHSVNKGKMSWMLSTKMNWQNDNVHFTVYGCWVWGLLRGDWWRKEIQHDIISPEEKSKKEMRVFLFSLASLCLDSFVYHVSSVMMCLSGYYFFSRNCGS